GRDTTVDYDAYDLVPIINTDSVGLRTQAEYDYRVMQPRLVTDPNGNRTALTFTPVGLMDSKAFMGKTNEPIGDSNEMPGTRLVYDFLGFVNRGEPISIHTVRRVHHVNDVDVPLEERGETIESVEYSDGFGRLLQMRTQAEDVLFGDSNFGDTGLL